MRILHIAAHLGGGIGKAHAAIARELPRDVEQTFLLLEPPIDRRHAHVIVRSGGRVVVERDPAQIRALALQADIVQLEYWGHPLLNQYAQLAFAPGVKTVCWSHVSGLFAPALPTFLAVDRLVLTSDISLPIVPWAIRNRTSVINSGFGFTGMRSHARPPLRKPAIAYLGTVDFKKLHREIFDAVDALDDDMDGDLAPIALWGHINPEVAAWAAAMRHPERIALRGHTLDPLSALAEADIFFYPLRRDHYGTAENALVEAMSMGLVPVVLDNPAETKIVAHGKSGFVAHTIDECVSCLRRLVQTPSLREQMAANAARAAQRKSPAHSADAFVALWAGLVAERSSTQVRQYA
ncbi:glycosyltransferase [Bradyrhizobium sp.]|uniref:glycosyltransferase n=1 Tax=Bradyrhizobium sp. TaxID=376 RepID=UPI003C3DDF45